MKTTMNLPDALLDAVKRRAHDEGRTQTSVIEEALRRHLSTDSMKAPRPMPTFGVAGADSLLIDLDDKDALSEVFDGDSAA